MARLREIVFDSEQPAKLARFWAKALDGYSVRPYGDAEIQRLAARGLTPETDPAVAVDGPGPVLFFQQRHPGASRGPVHLDLEAADRPAEVARLRALGASVRDEHEGYTVLLDPEGNAFCVVDLG